MLKRLDGRMRRTGARLDAVLTNPGCLAVVPTLCLGVFWAGGQTALIAMTLVFPLLYMLIILRRAGRAEAVERSAVMGRLYKDAFDAIVDRHFTSARETGLKSALFEIEIDDHRQLIERYGRSAADAIAETLRNRLRSIVRDSDALCQTADFRFAICLAPGQNLDLEACIQFASRVQAAIEQPVSLDGTTIHLTGCVGFCLHTRMLTRDGEAWRRAARYALREAMHCGPNAIRAYTDELRKKAQSHAELREEVAKALELGQIQPWFQPQISTDTGLVTGFEALARWNHPNRGMIAPSSFLPAIEQIGMLERLAETMLCHAFTALKAWDAAGVSVPQVGVNFAGPELSNPKLVEKVKWELDRFDLAPERLAVEVLETVVASAPDDTITRNINALSKLGCRIDLDDFGTGHASIASIRRFAVSRIKIDRSFVIKSDRDPEQQRMISAILTMAERLEVETLAEGVETAGEHALLAQLGCNHVQGFGIGKPMPFDQTLDWIAQHNAKLEATPKIIGNRSI